MHVPAPALRTVVGTAVGYRVPALPSGVHRGLPSPWLSLAIDLCAPLRVEGLGAAVTAHGVLGGLHTGPALIDATAAQEGLQYTLSPLTAGSVLGLPAAALQGSAVALDDVLGPAADRLVEQLATTDSWAQRFALVDAALLRRLSGPPVVGDTVRHAWELIMASGGRLTVAAVAERVGWSRRHLSAQLRSTTGLSPKQVARVARFGVTRRALSAADPRSLAEIAVRCGYADQSHLAREWKTLAGCTVGTWMREEFPFVQDGAAGQAAS